MTLCCTAHATLKSTSSRSPLCWGCLPVKLVAMSLSLILKFYCGIEDGRTYQQTDGLTEGLKNLKF